MHPIIEKHRRQLEAACRKFGVTRLDVFGSAARDDFDPQQSDLDFVVEFERPGPMNASAQYFGFLFELEDLFQRGIDLVEMDGVANPYLRESINKDRAIIYDAQSTQVPV